MGPLAYQSASALIQQLRSGKIRSMELVEQSISRIERYDDRINAVVVRDFDRAREAAIKADKALARGDSGALLGLPITIKESYSVAGFSKSWGVKGYEKKLESSDGVVAKRLKKEGAIILAKTNVPRYLGDWQTYNEIYGVTNNPWNLSLTCGGSSGGSAAAVAAGFSSLDFGSDLNGSLRVPAHCCGVYAHNPSFGLVPQRGHEPPGIQSLSVSRGMDFGVNGPIARYARDLELGLKIIAGPDDDMAIAYKLSLPESRHKRLEDFRVLILNKHPFLNTSQDVEAALESCAAHLVRRGVAVERSAVGYLDLEIIASTFLQQLMALLSVDLPDEEYKKAQAQAMKLAPTTKNLEAFVLGGRVLSYRDFARLGRIRTQLRHQWRELFKQFDVVLCPVMPITAFPHDHSADIGTRSLRVDDQQIAYGAMGMWCSLATLTGQPLTVMPIGQSREALPIGMQIIGPFLEDLSTIEFAHCLEREFGGFNPPPGLD